MGFHQWMNKKKGDRLKADEVNELARQAYRKPGQGSNIRGQHTSRVDLSSGYEPFFQMPVEVVALVGRSEGFLDVCTFTYTVSTLYYDAATKTWKKTFQFFDLDTSSNQQHLCVGDRVNAYWHDQRGAFVPTHPDPIKAYLTSNLYPFGYATGKTMCSAGIDIEESAGTGERVSVPVDCSELCDVVIVDPIGLTDAYWMSYAPIGTCVYLWPRVVDGAYLLLAIGGSCCGIESSSNSSSSQSSTSSSSSSSSSSTSSSSQSLQSGYGCPTEISGVPVTSLEVVTPAVGDYVVGWKDGCIVLFPIDDCDESSSISTSSVSSQSSTSSSSSSQSSQSSQSSSSWSSQSSSKSSWSSDSSESSSSQSSISTSSSSSSSLSTSSSSESSNSSSSSSGSSSSWSSQT